MKYRSENPKLLRSQFVHLFRLAFQNKKLVEHSNIVFGLFLVFSFSFPSLNSSTDQSRLWKWLASYEAIFLQKNAPKLLECAICQSRGTASERHGFVHQQNNDTAIESVDKSFFIGEKNRKTNQLAPLARRDYFYLDAF